MSAPAAPSPATRFLELADAGAAAGWRYALGLVLIVCAWLGGGGWAYALAMHLPLGSLTEFVAVNASLLTLLAAVLLVVRGLHRRPWRTLLTPRPALDGRRIALGAGAWVALALLAAAVEHALYPGRMTWTLDPARWLPFVAAALLLTPLQCAAEELLFRGYLAQALGRAWRQPVAVAVASSLLFMLPHLFNPEVERYGLAWMAANYFVMGLFLASLALRDGRLELALGAHIGNNLLLALVINYEDSVFQTAAVITAAEMDPAYSLVTLLLSAVLFHAWVFRRARPGAGFTAAELAQFHRAGYLVVRGLVPAADVRRMRAVAERDLAAGVAPVELEADTGYPGAPESRGAPGGATVRRLLQAAARDAVFRDWALAQPLAVRLRQLLGPQVLLSQAHHNCIMTKDPRHGSETRWHRDIRYWSFARPELVSVWLALGEERQDNGGLLVLPGTQAMEFDPALLDAAQFLRPELPDNARLLQTRTAVDLRAGDVLFFHSRLFHAAGNNRGTQTKFSVVFTYRAADNPPLPGTRSAGLPEIALPPVTGA